MTAHRRDGVESAIPPHLLRGDRPPKHAHGTYTPPNAGYTARFDSSTTAVVMAYFGVQARDADTTGVRARLRRSLSVEDGPDAREDAHYIDGWGYRTSIAIAYWTDAEAFDRWIDGPGAWWIAPAVAFTGIGRFLELARPRAERFETLISSQHAEGVARTAPRLSGPVEEHGYWGSMRDRLPVARTDSLDPRGAVELIERGELREVVLPVNSCLIRSLNDIGGATPEEKAFYYDEVGPALQNGMRFLQDDGAEIGCYDSRLMTVLDERGAPTDASFGLSWWVDLSHLEEWSRSHETHLRIFGSAMRYLTAYGERANLRLYHEVTVVDRDESTFLYVGCHDRTGLLRAAL